jgi:hypothetical protein
MWWSAVINAVVSISLSVVIGLIAACRKSVMGFTSSRPIVILGWITVTIMGLAAVPMFTLARVSTSTGRD